jgi:hypothetical protein
VPRRSGYAQAGGKFPRRSRQRNAVAYKIKTPSDFVECIYLCHLWQKDFLVKRKFSTPEF